MDFRISDTFTDSLAKLTGEEQKAVKTTAFDLQMNPANPGNPQRQAAAPTQTRFIFRPVLHLEGHFRNMMTAVGIVLIWHGVHSKKQSRIVPSLPSCPECTNAGLRHIFLNAT